jgi:hypothetical protein
VTILFKKEESSCACQATDEWCLPNYFARCWDALSDGVLV